MQITNFLNRFSKFALVAFMVFAFATITQGQSVGKMPFNTDATSEPKPTVSWLDKTTNELKDLLTEKKSTNIDMALKNHTLAVKNGKKNPTTALFESFIKNFFALKK